MTDAVNILTDPSSLDEADRVSAAIADRIASFRKSRRISFDQLAARCGVSKGMLVQIEQGKANPSIGILCRIAAALKVSVAELVEVGPSENRKVRVVSAAESSVLWSGPLGGSARLLIGSDGPEMLEQWLWELNPGERFDAQIHPSGTQELISVFEGSLLLHVDGVDHLIESGASAHALTDCEHAYSCSGDAPVRFVMVVLEPASQ